MQKRAVQTKVLTNSIRIALVLSMIACSDARLIQRKDQPVVVQSKGEFCLQSPDTNDRITKFMFVIDKSGSNDTTDNNNKYRADAIETFYKGAGKDGVLRKDNPNIKWGYITFQGSSAAAYINSGSDQKPIYVGLKDTPPSTTAMANALKRQRSDSDYDTTPYHEALNLTRRSIQDDMKAHPDEQSEYVVFFMSDGMPTDYNGFGNEQPAGPEAFKDVDDLVATNPGHVHFSTAYYGKNNADASTGLQKMAEHGFGKFVDLNKTSDFKIDDLLVAGSTSEPYNMKQFLVYNVNSAIGLESGEMCGDSDGDGLCDEDEMRLSALGVGRFDPQDRFSWGDGYGDYFHYLEIKGLTKLKPCTDRTDEDHDLLTVCEENFMYNDKPTGVPANYTSKNTNPKDPDTDGEGFIDGIEFFMIRDKSTPLDRFNLTKHPVLAAPDMATLIFQHRNPLKWDPNLSADDTYDTHIEFTRFNDQGQRCYEFDQQHLKAYHTLHLDPAKALAPEYAHAEWDNKVLVYYIQTLEKNPDSPGVYNYSVQNVSGKALYGSNHSQININDAVFKSYVPK